MNKRNHRFYPNTCSILQASYKILLYNHLLISKKKFDHITILDNKNNNRHYGIINHLGLRGLLKLMQYPLREGD